MLFIEIVFGTMLGGILSNVSLSFLQHYLNVRAAARTARAKAAWVKLMQEQMGQGEGDVQS